MAGLSLRPFGKKIRDIFDANTESDQQKRVAQGQPKMYQDQQRAMGRNAYTNPIVSVARNAVVDPVGRAVNTLGVATGKAGRGYFDISNVAKESVFGTDQSYKRTLEEATNRINKGGFSKTGGLLDLGTNLYDTKDLRDPKKFTGAVLETGADIASVAPLGKSGSLALKGAKVFSKPVVGNALISGASNMASNVGTQYRETGKFDLGQNLTAGAIGTALPITLPAAGRITRVVGDKIKSIVPDKAPVSIKSTGIEPVTPPKPTVGKPTVTLKQPDAPVKLRDDLSFGQKISPDRIIRENITQPLERGVNKALFKAQTSKNPIVRTIGRASQGISREAGVSPELLQQKRLMRGGIETGKLVRAKVGELGDGFTPESKSRVWATIDTEQAAKQGVTVDPATLTPKERVYRQNLTNIQDELTQGNLQRNLIDEGQASNPNYLKRGYTIFEENSDASKAYNQTKKNLLAQFKGRKDISEGLIDDAITDPGYLVGKKAAESHAAWAMVDHGNYLVKSGMVSDVAKPGFRQLPNSKIYGEAAGKYVPTNIAEDFTGFQYTNGMLNAWNDLITAYDSLGIRRAKKQLLTVFNPAVRAGNQFSNRAIFANMSGINPLQFNKNYVEVGKLIKNNDPLYREAVAQGLTGIDITQADFAKKIADYTDPNIGQKALQWTRKSYSAADDKARVTAYVTHRKRGYTPEEAAQMTQRGFQDYNSVGFFYDQMAKTPLIGNAFVRFAGDALRIATNAALDHPLRNIATVALWANFVNIASKVSGETPEDKTTREDRFGAPKIPFTDISMTVQTPWGEVNVARFMPFYQLNDVQNPLARVSPIQGSPVGLKDGKLVTNGSGFQDPLLGQFAQLALDKDFRNKSIRDPENTVDADGNKRYGEPLPAKEQALNVGRFLGTQNLPFGREADSVVSAATGTKDVYGKERSVPQSILRAGGIKVEQFGAKQAQENRDTKAYFDERDEIDKELKGLPKSAQEAYKRLTGYNKLREKVPNEFDPGATRDKKAPVFNFSEDKWKDYTSNPELYDLMLSKKERENQRQGSPIQPEFDKRLSSEFRKQLVNNKSLAPGEDVEADQRMYSNSEWDLYNQLKEEYKAAAAKYYPEKEGEFVDELVKHQAAKFPEKGAAKKAYDDAYQAYAKGQGPKPAYNDQVDAEKDAYNEAKRTWTNTERKARGLSPISKEVWDNVTFGFESDEEKVYKELKYGRGFGGGFGKTSDPTANPYKYAVSLDAGGKSVKPKVSVKGGKIAKAYKSKKPKVSKKKSLV